MIEVEKKFKLTKGQLESLLRESEFVCTKDNHDIYYDYKDYRLLKSNIKLRNRNGNFELKIKTSTGVNIEIEKIEEIKKYFKIINLDNFVKENLQIIIDYKTTRNEYKNDEFIIDHDVTDFDYELCEIELMVNNNNEEEKAKQKILEFALAHNFNIDKVLSKRMEYLRRFKPDIYREIYCNKFNEIKMK